MKTRRNAAKTAGNGENAAKSPENATDARDMVSPPALAGTLGVHARSLSNFVAQGMPKPVRGKYSLAQCSAWYIARQRQKAEMTKAGGGDPEVNELRRRKLAAETQLIEIKVGIVLGRLVPLEAVGDAVAAVCGAMVPILQNVPVNYGNRLEELGIPAEKAEAILEEFANELTGALAGAAGDIESGSLAGDAQKAEALLQ